MSKKTGRLFIVSGPSGSGKDTVLKEIFKRCPEIEFSISSITRPMREGEVEGEKYNFISREKFEDMLKNDQLLEHNVFVGNYYGTPKDYVEEQLNAGKDVLLEIEIQGALQVKEKLPETVLVFIMPPSVSELYGRLKGRGTETDEVIRQRMLRASEESQGIEQYDYILVNDDIDTCVESLHQMIQSEKQRACRNTAFIECIRKEFVDLMKGEL